MLKSLKIKYYLILVFTLITSFVVIQRTPHYTYPPMRMSAHVKAFEKAKTDLCEHNKYCAILAKALVWESRGEPLIGKEAIGFTILNRVKDTRMWPNNIYDVVKQKNQFSFWGDKHKQTPPTKKDWEIGYIVAFDVLNGLVDNPISGANHYHSLGVEPKWTKKMEFVAQIGNHKFYKY